MKNYKVIWGEKLEQRSELEDLLYSRLGNRFVVLILEGREILIRPENRSSSLPFLRYNVDMLNMPGELVEMYFLQTVFNG